MYAYCEIINRKGIFQMKQFKSINTRNGREFILTFKGDEIVAHDIEKGKDKVISENTVKRWHEIGEEIKQEKPKKRSTKSNGQDKRKKVTAEQVREIRQKKAEGMSISALAKEFGMSYSGMYWIVKGNTWANLDKEDASA